jgi:predicted transcriptional regulator of viral defense system
MLEKNFSKHESLANFVDRLQSEGRYTFTCDEAMNVLHVSRVSLKKSILRLVQKKRLVVPKRGFYVIIPLEYRAAEAPPPSWFVDDLMHYLNKPYYVGGLSAAAIHGASHQQPQEFQIVTPLALRPIIAGRMRFKFFGKTYHAQTPIIEIKTETGKMRVSTPEATALDLLRYVSSAGGLSNVVTVLAELSERIDPKQLADVAAIDEEFSYAQRLGFLLDLVGAEQSATHLIKFIEKKSPRNTPLQPGRPIKGCSVDRRWHVVINEQLEMDQ